MPLGYFYSPFLPEANTIKTNPAFCAKCRASISSYAQKNKNTKTWICSFCNTSNPLHVDIGISQVEEYV
jgi:transcription elongation factor Elf1